MQAAYPAIFDRNEDGSYTITFPDLPGCISEGKSIENALYMAQSALTQFIGYLIDEGDAIPSAGNYKSIPVPADGFVNYITADIKDSHAVRRTVSLPKWQDEAAAKAGLSLSRVLQDALTARLG